MEKPPASNADPGSTRLIFMAIALALVAVIVTNVYIASIRRDVEMRSFDVFVLTRTVKPGDKFKADDFATQHVPERFKKNFMALGAVLEEKTLATYVETERFERAAQEGALLTHALFTSESAGLLDVTIDPGHRYMDLPVNGRLVPAGIRPGVDVDIEATIHTGEGVPRVLLVVEKVKVVGVDRQTIVAETTATAASRHRRISKITIQVKPEQGTQLSMVEKIMSGDFELRLRHPSDNQLRLSVPPGEINPIVLDLIGTKRRQPPDRRR